MAASFPMYAESRAITAPHRDRRRRCSKSTRRSCQRGCPRRVIASRRPSAARTVTEMYPRHLPSGPTTLRPHRVRADSSATRRSSGTSCPMRSSCRCSAQRILNTIRRRHSCGTCDQTETLDAWGGVGWRNRQRPPSRALRPPAVPAPGLQTATGSSVRSDTHAGPP
jgi:hypothetical protein